MSNEYPPPDNNNSNNNNNNNSNNQLPLPPQAQAAPSSQQQQQHPPPPSAQGHPQPPPPHRYQYPYPAPPHHGAPYPASGHYSVAGPYHHQPPAARPSGGPSGQGQGPAPVAPPPPSGHMSSPPRHGYDRDEHAYHRQVMGQGHEADYRGHLPPPTGAYQGPPPPHYGPPPPEDRRWMGLPEGVAGHPPPHRYSYPPPPPVAPGMPPYHHHHHRYPPHPYPPSREENVRIHSQPPPPPPTLPPAPQQAPAAPAAASNNNNSNINNNEGNTISNNDVDGREGASSPSQIEMSHRDEVTNMGCTCKKTKCLKLYCQCFAVKIYCGANCRCLGCFNTVQHEKMRKEAMRSILSRNPTAFDTKFSKTKERKQSKEQPQLVLAHKLGCKCRKSACIKKYCECYAGNVKCSSNCRCVGCKNTSDSGYGPGKPGDHPIAIHESSGMHEYEGHPYPSGRTGREPWMMNAAQNLTFLKHGSPTTEKRTKAVDAGDMGSMPSLAASSSDTSPGERGDDSLAKAPLHDQEDTDGNSGVNVNTLLMAAYAMTEFQSQPRKDNATKIPPKEDDETLDQKAPPRQSPKRKSSEVLGPDVAKSEDHQAAEAAAKQFALKDDDDAKSSSPMEPVDPREMKRTRLGSARENTNRNMDDGVNHGSPDNSGPTSDRAAFMQETPDQKTMGGDKLTPVSARCIDFKRMHMNEKGKVERS